MAKPTTQKNISIPDSIRQVVLLAAFLLVPYGFLSFGETLHIGHQYALVLSAVMIVASMIKNNRISLFLVYLTGWMLFILIFRMLYPIVPAAVAKSALETVQFILVGSMIFFAVTKSKIKSETFYDCICVAALLQTLEAACQFLGFDPVRSLLNLAVPVGSILLGDAVTGTLYNPNFLAAFLAISLPFFFREKWYYGLILVLPILFLCKTTSAIVPAIIGAIYFFHGKLTKREFWIGAVGGFIVIAAYALFSHGSILANPRWIIWEIILLQVLETPASLLFGYGPGAGWGQPYPMHNEWLQTLHQFGLIGMTLLIGYVLKIGKSNRILFTAFIIATINMFGNSSLHLAPSAFLIIIVAGLIERDRISI